jgi:hypothetical protein
MGTIWIVHLFNTEDVAVVDAGDKELVANVKWHRGGGDYRYVMNTKGEYIHRVIMGANPGDPHIDHKDRNVLNNCRLNLRFASPTQNNANQRSRIGSTSKFKGVTWDKATGRWRAVIQIDKHVIGLGRFVSEILAARAYDQAALEAWGEFALLNFSNDPQQGEMICP